MIGERFVPGSHVSARGRALPRRTQRRPERGTKGHPEGTRRRAPAGKRHLARQPAFIRAGSRERLVEALGQPVLVQLMLAMTFVAVAALLYLAQASQASVLEFNIAAQQSQQIQLDAQNASLQFTATALQSLQRVDQIATTQLHMTKPDPSSAIWVRPVIPNVVAIRPLNADTLSAQRQSEPLAWMARVITRIKSVL